MRPTIHPWLLLWAAGSLTAGEVLITSRTDQVTVYLDRAMVTRSAEVPVKTGRNDLVFAGLPAELDDSSLRLVLRGTGRIVSVISEPTWLDQLPEEELRNLQARIDGLTAEKAKVQQDLGLLDQATEALNQIQKGHLDQMVQAGANKPAPDVADYGKFLDFLAARRQTHLESRRKLVAEDQRLSKELDRANRDMVTRHEQTHLEQRKVTVQIEAPTEAPLGLSLSYMLPGALWMPTYDLRADLETKTIEITYAAAIQNATGEDWTGVALTLSAMRPTVSTVPPLPIPWTLGGVMRNPVPNQITFLNIEGPTVGNANHQSGQSGNANQPVEVLAQQGKNRKGRRNQKAHEMLDNNGWVNVIAAAVEERRTSVVLRVPGTHTQQADGRRQRVVISTSNLPMTLSRYAVPAQSPNVYLVGSVINRTDMPFLPGDAQLYISGQLNGSVRMDFMAQGEQAALCLGLDERLKVTRSLDPKRSAKSQSSSRRRLDLTWNLQVANFHDKPVTLDLHECLPVSQDEEIRCRNLEVEPRVDIPESGLVTWKLKLEPGKPQDLTASYTIEYPLASPSNNGRSVAPAAEYQMDLDMLEKKLSK